MKKKLLIAILMVISVICLAFVFTACDNGSGSGGGSGYEDNTDNEQDEEKPNYTEGLAYSEVKKNGEVIAYSISGKGSSTDSDVIIGAEYNGLPVISIGSNAFKDSKWLTSITLPDSITSIGVSAFSGCTELTNINIPDSVESIGSSAFNDCTSIEEIHIPESVTSISDYTFNGCTSLRKITLPDSVTSIGISAFYGCSGLKSLNIPENIISIGIRAFYGCTGLTKIDFNAAECEDFSDFRTLFSGAGKDGSGVKVNVGKNVKRIPAYLFYSSNNNNYSKITSVVFENGSVCTGIGNNAFSCCCELKSINIPEGTTTIGNSAFDSCEKLTSIVIPDTVTKIGGFAFKGCIGLNSLTIGKNVTSIGAEAFRDCTKLITINYNATECADFKEYDDAFTNAGAGSDGISLNIGVNVKKIPAYVFYRSGLISKNIKLLNANFLDGGVCESIGESAFRNCSFLKIINIGDKIKSIGDYAFANCAAIENLILPDNVIAVGKSAFSGCKNIRSATIGDGVTSIGTNAFNGCSELKSLIIGKGVASIGNAAFRDCSSLTEIIYNAVKSADMESTNTAFENAGKSGTGITVRIGEEVESIPDYLFYRYNIGNSTAKITSILFSEGSVCETIGNYSFYKSVNISDISIPDSVISIGEYAFNGCTGLKRITIGKNVTEIGANAFSGCSGLLSLDIPDSVTIIGKSAFRSCSALELLTLGSGIKQIGNYAYDSCTELKVINYNAVECAGLTDNNYVFDSAGKGGSGIKLNIGENVKYIPSYLFCSSNSSFTNPKITEIVFEKDCVCTKIGEAAFKYCKQLAEIKYNGNPEKWETISKGVGWDTYTGEYTLLFNEDNNDIN